MEDEPPDGSRHPMATTEEPSSVVAFPPTPDSADTGEHKVVTVLCGGLVDAADWAERLGAEAMHHLMQTLLARVQHIMQRYDGTLVQVSGEGFVGLFGAPVAHEDHARRAVLAAVDLRQYLREEAAFSAQTLGKRVVLRLGLHTGPIVVGPLPHTPQLLFTAIGATTTLATVLQQQANPDAIVLSAVTYELVQTEIHAMPAGTLNLAEQTSSLLLYTVHGVQQRRGGVPGRIQRPLTRFVGREGELAVLHEHLSQARQGRGHVVGIIGEPGMGKSRLLYEFAQQVGEQAVTYYEGHCLPYGTTTPYGPLLDVLRQHCGLPNRAAPATVTAAVHRMLAATGLALDETAPFLLQLLNISVSSEPFAPLSPQARRVRTFALLRQIFLHTSRQQPLVLGIENGHWLDATSEEWLLSLVEQVSSAPFLLLVTYRPGYSPPWGGQSVATQVSLAPLPSVASRAIVQMVAQTMPLPEWRIQDIIAKAAGNPFFLEELTQTALEQDGEPTTLRIPETIQAVLTARIDRLPAEIKRLLQTAAVIGHDVPLELLQTVGAYPEITLHQHLHILQHAEILYEKQAFPQMVYTFKHALTHEVVYSSLLQEQRRTLHARIVVHLEALDPNRLVDQIEQLSYHAWRGELWGKAVQYARQAGGHAMARSAYQEAVAHYEQVLKALQHLPESSDTIQQAIDLHLTMRVALQPLQPLGDFSQILLHLREAERLAEALGDPQRLARCLAYLGNYLTATFQPTQAIPVCQRAVALATAHGDRILQLDAQYRLSRAYFDRGDFQQVIPLLTQIVESLTGDLEHAFLGYSAPLAVVSRFILTLALGACGSFAEGRIRVEETVRIAAAIDHPLSHMFAAQALAWLSMRRGDFTQAIVTFEQVLVLGQSADIPGISPDITAALGVAYAWTGRVHQGLHLVDQALERHHAMTKAAPPSALVLHLGEVYFMAGRLDEAISLARQAFDLSRARQEHGLQGYVLWLLGRITARREPSDAHAKLFYCQALDLATALSCRPLQALCHHSLGTLYSEIGQAECAYTELTMAIELYRAMDMAFWPPQAEAALAQLSRQGQTQT
jgi:class 3 adenylate cyclase/tetratricopeptide (TPR) repeat protein